MSTQQESEADRLLSRAATARRLAAQVTQQLDRDRLLKFAAELEARAARLQHDRPGDNDS